MKNIAYFSIILERGQPVFSNSLTCGPGLCSVGFMEHGTPNMLRPTCGENSFHTGRNTIVNCLLAVMLIASSNGCATASEREKSILNYAQNSPARYDDCLVQSDQYTTNGAYYHKKYYTYLIGIAGRIADTRKATVAKHSIGFYYDKKENRKERLYLGVDIIIPPDQDGKEVPYGKKAAMVLDEYLRDVMDVIHSCTAIFLEKEIVGMVIGFQWEAGGHSEYINIWIDEKDVLRFENSQLTFRN